MASDPTDQGRQAILTGRVASTDVCINPHIAALAGYSTLDRQLILHLHCLIILLFSSGYLISLVGDSLAHQCRLSMFVHNHGLFFNGRPCTILAQNVRN